MAAEERPVRTILLVEDNELNLMVAEGMLGLLGLTADVARNGVQAVDAVLSARYETVLMDIHMPEMDGFEATRRIRAAVSVEIQPYIIALTANAMVGDRKRCLDAGMDDYLSKPLTKDGLAAAMQRSRQRRVDQGAAEPDWRGG